MSRLSVLLSAMFLLAASLSPAGAEDKTITVFAAASMKNALDEVAAAYPAMTGVKFSVSYAASSVLARQIEQGAPADVFVSADTDWMDYAISKKTINEPTRVNLLGNSIVLIAPKDSRLDNVPIAQGFDLAKLAGDGRIATGDVKSVPVGTYAKEELTRLGACPGGPEAPRIRAGGGAEIRHGRERAGRADAGRAWRGQSRHRLFHRCQGRARREDRRHLPGGFASRDHLSRRGDHDSKGRDQRLSHLPALDRRQDHSGKIRFQVPDQPLHLILRFDARHLSRRMDGDPALAQGCRDRDAGGNAVRHCAGVAARAA